MISELAKIFEEFWWLGIISLSTFFLTIFLLPLVIVHLPSDYFINEKADGFINRQKGVWRISLLIAKNLAGALMLFMGFIMLFVPGQGILTLLAGLSIMNFPGKRHLEIKLVSKEKVFSALNWIRTKGKRPRFQTPDKPV